MSIIIGIDIGGSTTKIVGLCDKEMIKPMQVKATDALTSVFGAFGKYTSENNIKLSSIDRIMVTGVGSSFIKERLYGIPTGKVDEFLSVGHGGLYLSSLKKAIIVSMGTGTAFIQADGNNIRHIGGTGVGGGTLLGLSNLILNIRSFDNIVELAKDGNLSNIDLTISDISKDKLTSLTPETTASNFGKLSDIATRSDYALGIINLIFQTIGMLSIFATKIDSINDVVLTGNLTTVPQTNVIFDNLNKIFGINFILPDYAEFATAFGAALSYIENVEFSELQ